MRLLLNDRVMTRLHTDRKKIDMRKEEFQNLTFKINLIFTANSKDGNNSGKRLDWNLSMKSTCLDTWFRIKWYQTKVELVNLSLISCSKNICFASAPRKFRAASYTWQKHDKQQVWKDLNRKDHRFRSQDYHPLFMSC